MTFWAEAAVSRIFLGCSKYIGRRNKSEMFDSSMINEDTVTEPENQCKVSHLKVLIPWCITSS